MELIVDGKSKLYLIEMNKSLKVENKVKEIIKGIDIVEEMIRVE